VDHALVKSLRVRVADGLRTERRTRAEAGRPLSSDDARALGHALTLQVLREHRMDELNEGSTQLAVPEEDAEITAAVAALLFGLGRLQPLLDDETVTNIEINGCDHVWLSLDDGRVIAGPSVADSDAELVELIRTAAVYGGLSSRPFDPANPWLEMRLPDGSRLCALMSVVDRPTVSIRCYRMRRVRLADLLDRGGMTRQVGAFLRACVLGRMNLMISGETFAGKTTLLRALGNEIPAEERLITAEHFLELGFQHYPDLHRDVVAMEERLPNAEGVGALTLTDLVERSRRMNPDRIIVGEVIGSEIVAMLDAMTQGNDGSLSTIHARSAEMVVHRIATYAMTSATRLPIEASHLLTAGALDFVVHVAKRRAADGRLQRYVSSIREIVGYDGVQVVSSEVFSADKAGASQALPAASITDRRVAVLEESGYSPGAWALSAVAG
jgi:Flp pilus assembly CpaF family ATPase